MLYMFIHIHICVYIYIYIHICIYICIIGSERCERDPVPPCASHRARAEDIRLPGEKQQQSINSK